MSSGTATRSAAGARALYVLGLLGALALLGGCGGGSPVISGQVTYKKQLLTTGEVSFIAADGKSRSGLIGADGRYEIRDAPEGPVMVVVVARKTEVAASPGSPLVRKIGEPAPAPIIRSLVPEKYNDPRTSGLSYVVVRGTQTKDLNLED
jgi:hypothetical protein